MTERPTAIFAGNDFMAYGVIAAAEEYGLRVPQDVAVVGFDDTSPSAHMQPALTTVRQPFYEMGQNAIELLLSLVDSPRPVSGSRYVGSASSQSFLKETEPIRIQLPSTLVVRASCGAPRRVTIE